MELILYPVTVLFVNIGDLLVSVLGSSHYLLEVCVVVVEVLRGVPLFWIGDSRRGCLFWLNSKRGSVSPISSSHRWLISHWKSTEFSLELSWLILVMYYWETGRSFVILYWRKKGVEKLCMLFEKVGLDATSWLYS